MDYVSNADFKALIADFETGSEGVMTSTELTTLVEIIEGEVNGVLASLGVLTPIVQATSPRSYTFIRALVVQGTVALVQSSIHAISDDTEGSREAAFWRRYEQGIRRMIENGGAALVDAETLDDDRNGAATMGDQDLDVDHYLGLRDVTHVRHYENILAARRLLPRVFRSPRFFDGPVI